MMNKEQIIQVLKREDYPSFMIESTVEKIGNFCPKVKNAFEQWMKTGNQCNLVIEGYGFRDLSKKYGMTPVGAFITLDWLYREPQKAKSNLMKGIK